MAPEEELQTAGGEEIHQYGAVPQDLMPSHPYFCFFFPWNSEIYIPLKYLQKW